VTNHNIFGDKIVKEEARPGTLSRARQTNAVSVPKTVQDFWYGKHPDREY
jgi:hypothetical protein